MPYEALDGYVFVGCAVRSAEILGLWAQRPDADDPLEPDPTTLFLYHPNKPPEKQWAHRGPVPSLGVHAAAAFQPKEQWVAVFSDGDVYVVGGGDDGPERPVDADGVAIRAVREVAGHVHALAAGAVYRRDARDRWVRLAAGLPRDADLRDLDGYALDALFACGGSGLWFYDGAAWSQRSVENAERLERVCCGTDRRLYLVDGGARVRAGTPGGPWREAAAPAGERLSTIAWYRDRLVAATPLRLLEMTDRGLVPSTLSPPALDGYQHLAARAEILLVAGSREAACYDGRRWARIV